MCLCEILRVFCGKTKILINMKRILIGFFIASIMIQFMASCQQKPIYKDPKANIEDRVEDLLKQMTLDEKLEQIAGYGESGFDAKINERLGIPAFKMSDGPLGVRWGKSTSFPCGAAVAATWDTALVTRFALALAEETHAKGRNYLLGPCVNIHRFPAGGRNFESYGEDPFLTLRLAVNYVKALQSQQVIACIKHFALNNQEWRRTEINVTADERTMREIYLPSFEAAVKEGGVYSVMSAYNKVNGWWCSENKELLTDILKNDWGFKGVVVSDWGSTHSTEHAANNGLDIEMPDAYVFVMDSLRIAIKEGRISEETINDKVRRILRVKFMAGLFDKPYSKPEELSGLLHTKESVKLAREIAEESIILLKNEDNLLPLKLSGLKSIAVKGPNANQVQYGDYSVTKDNSSGVTILEGIINIVKDKVKINYATVPCIIQL